MEFEEAIAVHTGVWRESSAIFVKELIDHLELKLLGEIDSLQGNTQMQSHLLNAIACLGIAALVREDLGCSRSERIAPQVEVHTENFMTFFCEEVCDDTGIHTAGHRDEDTHGGILERARGIIKSLCDYP
jgi:hypothetical protein